MGSLRNVVGKALARLGVILTELARIDWYSTEAERLYRERRSRGRPAADPGGRAFTSEPAPKYPGEARRREAARAQRLWGEVDRLSVGGGTG